MAEVQSEFGTLPPPACYATEQERGEAYNAATTYTITGGIQWWVSESAPPTLDYFWLRLDVNGRPIEALKWSTADGVWLRWFSGMVFGADTGVADVYSIAPSPAFTAVSAYRIGSTYTFIANATNTGVVTGATFNVNGLGLKGIKKNVTDNLASGDIKVGQAVTLIYDGVNFQIASKTSEGTVHGVMYDPVAGLGKTWTVPVGVVSVEVECVGGGGGGDWFSPATAGGGGGGYCYQRWTVIPGTIMTYEVGAGGIRSTSAVSHENTNGGDTKFNAGAQIANGGVKASGGGTGGGFTTASGTGYGIQGSPGNTQTAGDKWIGGAAAWPGSRPGWSLTNIASFYDGILGGGGASDGDTSSNEATAGGPGAILIKW